MISYETCSLTHPDIRLPTTVAVAAFGSVAKEIPGHWNPEQVLESIICPCRAENAATQMDPV